MSEPTVLFLLGITPRSGTVYSSELLNRHPDIGTRPPPWEDFLLERIGPVADFAAGIIGLWRDRWDMDEAEANRFIQSLGGGIKSFFTEGATTCYVLLKTPTVENVRFAPLFFPRSPVILLVRDGRAVVESARLTFGWTDEEVTRLWVEGGRQILDFMADAAESGPPRLLVRYEELVTDTEGQLRRVFGALGLDPEGYDYARAAELLVFGSAVARGGADTVHWKPVTRPDGFNPLDHHRKNWTPQRLATFTAVAGEMLSALGYPPEYGTG
jgi:hypothetical protein